MARPPLQRYQQIPLAQLTGFDRIPDIETALQSLQQGQFRMAAILADSMFRDSRIWGVIDTRVGAIKSADVEVKPAQDRRQAEKVATILGGDETAPGIWDRLLPSATAADLITSGLMNGIAVGELVWSTSEDEWVPRIVPWHSQFVYWDWGSWSYKLLTSNGVIELPRVNENVNSDGKWFVWTPFGYQYAWRKAMVKPLADLYLQRRWVERDWSRYNEKHGSPVDVVSVPADASEEVKEAFFNDVLNRGADSAVMLPKREGQGEHDGYGLDILEADARTYDSFRLQLEKLDDSIAITILGQNLTTQVREGSRAAATVHDHVRLDKKMEDAAIAVAFRDQVLYWWAKYNFNDEELAPRARYVVEPAADELAESTALKMLGDAVNAMKLASNRVDIPAILDAHGVPLIALEDMPPEPPPGTVPPGTVPGVPGVPGATPPGAPPPKGAPTGAGEEAPGKKKAELVALSRAAPIRRARTKLYSDAVTDHAKAAARRATQVDLHHLRSAIASASGWPDLEARLKTTFAQMRPAALAKVVAKARIMARAGGMDTAWQQV